MSETVQQTSTQGPTKAQHSSLMNVSFAVSFPLEEKPNLIGWDKEANMTLQSPEGNYHPSAARSLHNCIQDNFSSFIGGAVFFLFLYWARPRIPDERWRFRNRVHQKQETVEEDPVSRNNRIAEALATMVVVGQDHDKNLTLGGQNDVDCQSNTSNDVFLDDCEERSQSECVICLEPFALGDDVAWAKSESSCNHVWHTECIHSWLQDASHNNCPSCRSVILQAKSKTDSDAERMEEGLLAGRDIDSTESPTSCSSSSTLSNDHHSDCVVNNKLLVILRGQNTIGFPLV